MACLEIFELDSNEEPVSTLKAGEHIFGRGPLLKCNDLRVSRKHGVIAVTDQTATIMSTHQNPCFYQAADSSTITILPKNNPVCIKDGDKFALLADQFWFRCKLTKLGSHDLLTNSAVVNLSSSCAENGRLSFLSLTSVPGSSKIFDAQADSSFPQEGDKPFKDIPKFNLNVGDATNNVNADDSSDSVDFLQSKQKRIHDVDVDSPTAKKAKFNDEKVDEEENVLSSVLENLKKNSTTSSSRVEDNEQATFKPESGLNNEVLPEAEEEENNKEPTSKTKEVMSESDSDDNKHVKGKVVKPTRNANKYKKGNWAASSSAYDLELKSMLFSSDEDNENPIDGVNTEVKTSSNSENNKINQDANVHNQKQKKREIDKSDKTDDNQNVASTSASSSDKKKPHRDRCWYKLQCYRKSASHLAEYSHPGDSDFDSDPKDDRPVCAFGAACYRRNKDHRQAYKHPDKPQKPPGGGKKPKKKTNKADTLQKRTARKQYNESSEDEYDLKDPFLDDSGTEYEATTSDDYDSDSDWSGASEEGTKRLLKEAKKFTRGKKKDKNEDDD